MAGSFTISLLRNPSSGDLESTYNPTPTQYTVTGSGFGTKLAQTPAIVERFTTGTEGQLVNTYDPTWIKYGAQNVGGYITEANARYSGAKSAANTFTRGQFSTNYKSYTASRAVYLSYWARIAEWTAGDYGVIKLSRITSSVSSGGGGVYNGLGGTSLGGSNPNSGNGFSSTNDAAGVTSSTYAFPYPTSGWVRVEHQLYLSDLDTANGFFTTRVGETAYESLSGRISRTTATQFLQDTILLGLEQANPNQFHYVTTFTPLATYTVTVNGTPRSYTAGASPDANEIITGVKAALDAASISNTRVGNELAIDPNASSVVWDSKFAQIARTPIVQNTDIFLDTSLQRFVLTNNATYASATIKEPQAYTSWSDTEVELTLFAPTITGDRHLFFVTPNSTGGDTTTYFGIV